MVKAAAEWETTLGTESFKRLINSGKTTFPYTYWNLGCISSEIWPIAWQDEYLNIGF